jgi:hypothetical protein
MTRIPTKLKPWFEARRRFKLSHAHTQMARELGMNPRKLGSLADGGQEPWKLPLPEFIVECYRKSFGRSEPEHVRSLEEVVQAEEKRRKEKQARKAEKMVIPAGSSQLAVQADGLASASQRQTRSRTLASARDTRTMRFHANHVSSSVSGDYYQAMFEAEEDTNDPNSPYLRSNDNSKPQMVEGAISRRTTRSISVIFFCAVSSSRRRGCQSSSTVRATILSALPLAWRSRTSRKHHR